MGAPRFAAADIPLAEGAGDPQRLVFPEPDVAAFGPAACVNVGNPHAVFFVADADAVPIATLGPRLERHPFFPRRANISFATVDAPDKVRVRVWERGAGATRACGTAACAVVAVGHHLGHLGEDVAVALPGGPLRIRLSGGRIVMAGPWSLDWTGRITESGFERDDVPAPTSQSGSGA
jgi:diaminopimelate epimerase